MRLPEQRDDADDVRPAIEVPLQFGPEYCVSLPFREELTLTPGAEMSGLMRFEPSTVTGPRLLKPASGPGFRCTWSRRWSTKHRRSPADR